MSGGLERISAGGAGEAETSHLARHDVPGSHDAPVHSPSEIAGNKVDTLKNELAAFLRYFESMQGPIEIIVEHERSFDTHSRATDNSSYERAQEMKSHVQAQLDLAQQAIGEYQKALWPDTGGKSVYELTPMRQNAYYDKINSIKEAVVDLQDAINEVGSRLYGKEWNLR